MKKILFFIDSLGTGGAQRQMVGLARLLKREGYSIKLLYYHPIDFYKNELDCAGIENECLLLAQNKFLRPFFVAKSVKYYKPDVVVSFLNTPNNIACLLKIVGMKFFLIAGERNTTQILDYKEKIKFYLMRWADAIVSNSYSQSQFIRKNYPKLSVKVSIITNYLDTDSFSPLIYNKRHRTLRIIAVGRIVAQKNIVRFLEAITILHKKGYRFKVDWFGNIVCPDYMDDCDKIIKNNQLNDCFEFHDPTQNIIKEYQDSDICCLPSLYEGCSNVICEAMACGLPIVCSNISDNPLLVKERINGLLFNPLDTNDMVNKLESMLVMSKEERQIMGSESRQLAIKLFSAEVFAHKYTDIIETFENHK